MRSKHGLLTVLTVVMLCAVTLAGPSGVAADSPESDGFAVEVTEMNTTVTAGERVVVTATVTNRGTETDSQQIHLKDFDDEIVDSVAGPPLTLAPGDAETVRLVWATTAEDAGTGTISVQSNDDYPRPELTVRPAPEIETTVGAIDARVTVGEPLTVTVSVENTGERTATPEIWLAHNGSETTNRTVTVAAGETERVNLTWTPTADEVGPSTLTVGTDYDYSEHAVTVTPAADPTDTPDEESRVTDRSDGGDGIPPNVRDRLRAPITGGTATFAGGDIRQVAFETNHVAGDVVATRFADRPEGVDAVENAVSYYEVTMPEEATDHNATIRFQLTERALGTNDSQRVGVQRWNGTEWDALAGTVETHSNGTAIAVDAAGDAVFAVTVDESTVDTAAAIATDQASTTEEQASTTESSERTPNAGENPASDEGTENPLTGIEGGVGAVLLFGTVGLLWGTRVRNR